MSVERIVHGRVELALHRLRDAPGPALLLLHGLGERSEAALAPGLEVWRGPVYALDFTGHGESTLPRGGGYTAELLMADADAALARVGSATLLGRGLGGYVAVLLAGGRPRDVRGAIVCDGPGLAGGGSEPGLARAPSRVAVSSQPPDPFALAELSRDVRPPDYARAIVDQAVALSGLARPVSVCAAERPAWLASLLDSPGVVERGLRDALADYQVQ